MGLFGTTIKDILKWENLEQVDKLLIALKSKNLKIKDAVTASMVNLILKWEKTGNVTKLIEVISVDQVEVKKAAINAMGNFRIIEAIQLFIQLLNHTETSVREEAINSILKLGPSATNYLIDAWNEINSTVAKAIEENLRQFAGLPNPIDIRNQVNDHFANQVRPVKRSIIYIFGKLELSYAPPTFFSSALKDWDEEIQKYAVEIIGNTKYFNLIDILKIEYNSVSYRIKIDIDNAISKLESRKAILHQIPIKHLREEILKDIIDSKDITVLLQITQLVSDTYQIEQIIIALGEIKAPQSVEPLISLLDNPHSGIKKQATVALGKIGDKNAVNKLIQNLACEDQGVIFATVETLGKLRDQKASSSLIKMFYDGSLNLAESIAKTLALLQEFEKLDFIMLSIADLQKKIIIAKILGKSNDNAVTLLKNLLLNDNTEIMVTAARALVDIEKVDQEIIEFLQDALHKDIARSYKERLAYCLINIAQIDFNLISQYWANIRNYIALNSHYDNRKYAYGDCPSDSGVHTDSGIFQLKLPDNL